MAHFDMICIFPIGIWQTTTQIDFASIEVQYYFFVYKDIKTWLEMLRNKNEPQSWAAHYHQ